MNVDHPRAKWHRIDEAATKALCEVSRTPGVVFPVGTNQMPLQFEPMANAKSYFISSYTNAVPLANNMTAGGEFVIVRADSISASAYNFVFATSSDGNVYYNGPHKNFDLHHFPASSAVPVASLFSHVSFSNKTTP